VKILETERLILREVTADDDEFILDLLNQPSFIKYIGDRGVRTLEQAREYIESRFNKSYTEHGYGLYAVELKNDAEDPMLAVSSNPKSEIQNPKSGGTLPTGRVSALVAIGVCGFVKRDSLPEPDIGFALLPQYEGKGYAAESARAMMDYGRDRLGFKRVLAITTLDNKASGRLLEKLGFRFDREVQMGGETLKLFSREL